MDAPMSMVPTSEEEFDSIMASISQAHITEALSPRPGSSAFLHSPQPGEAHLLGSRHASPYLSPPFGSSSNSTSPFQLSTHSSPPPLQGGQNLPPPLIFTPDGDQDNVRQESFSEWINPDGGGVSGGSTIDPIGQTSSFNFDAAYRPGSVGPTSDNGSFAQEGGSGYYTPSYASSYGSYQDDNASFLGDAFDGKLDFALGDGYDPGEEGAVDLGRGLAGMLEAWGEEQRRAQDGASLTGQGGSAGSGAQLTPDDLNVRADRAHLLEPSTASNDSDMNVLSSSQQFGTSSTPDFSLSAYAVDPPFHSTALTSSSTLPSTSIHEQQQQQQPSAPPAIMTQHLPSSPVPSPTSNPPSASSVSLHDQRSPPAISIPPDPFDQLNSATGFDSLPSASSLFPPVDPRMAGLLGRGAHPALPGSLGVQIEIQPATPLSGQLQSAVFTDTLVSLSQQRRAQTLREQDENSGGQQGQQHSHGGAPRVKQESPQDRSPDLSNSSSLSAASTLGSSVDLSHQYQPQPSSQPPPVLPPSSLLEHHQQYLFANFPPPSAFLLDNASSFNNDLPNWMASNFNQAASSHLSAAGPTYGQPSHYAPSSSVQMLQQQQRAEVSLNPSTADAKPVLKPPPRRQRSRSDASALPYDFGPTPVSAPTMNPGLLAQNGGLPYFNFFGAQQAQPMDSPKSSPRSISSNLPPVGAKPAGSFFNPLPTVPNTMFFNPSFPSYTSFAPTFEEDCIGPLEDGGGPSRTTHGSAQKSFGAGTPGYGIGLSHPWGGGGMDVGGMGVKRSVSDAGKGRKGHRKVQSVDMSYTRPDGTLGVPLPPARTPRRPSATGSSTNRSPARSPTPELRALPSDKDSEMEGLSASGSSVGSVTKQSVTTKKTAAASQGRRKTAAQFVCPIPGCGSTFTRSFNLKGHLRSHTDERPFKCQICQKGFARAHDCKRHQALHAGYRPHVCLGCDKRFARLDALSRHLKSEAGQECIRGGKMSAPVDTAGGSGGDDMSDGGSSSEGAGRGKGVLL